MADALDKTVSVSGKVRPIVKWIADLRKVSERVEVVDDDVRVLIGDMAATVNAATGIGISAIQIGVPRRVVVVRAPAGLAALINPEIYWRSPDKETRNEGCLSLPGVVKPVRRPTAIKVRWTDVRGKACDVAVGGILARVIQHEVDHLDGILIVDRSKGLARAA